MSKQSLNKKLKDRDILIFVFLVCLFSFAAGTAWGITYSLGAVVNTAVDYLDDKGYAIDKLVVEQFIQRGITPKYNNNTLYLKGGVENE